MGTQPECIFYWGSELKEQGEYVPGVCRLNAEMTGRGILTVDLEALLKQAGETQYAENGLTAEDMCRLMQAVCEELKLSEKDCMAVSSGAAMLGAAGQLGMSAVFYESRESRPEAGRGCKHVLLGFEEIEAEYFVRIWQRDRGLPWTILKTERCYLRELALEDLDDLFELYAQKGMTDYIEPLYERAKEEEYQRAYIANMYAFYGYGMWLVKEKGSGRLIGRAGLEHRTLHGVSELEMGYAIGVPYQRQGYATEVCRAILAYARDNLEYEEVNCLIEPENRASLGLVEKLGFVYRERISQDGKQYERYSRALKE